LGQDEDAADAQHDLTTGTALSAAAPPFIPRSVADSIAGLRVLVLCGLPGSGKSTLAGELSRRLGWSVVNQDTLGSRQACMKMARACLKADNTCVVIDRCNVDVKQRSVWVQLAMHEFGLGANVLGCVWLDVSVDECQERVMRRFGHSTLPAEASSKPVINGFAESWQSPCITEGFVRLWKVSSDVDMETLWAELLVCSGQHEDTATGLPQQASPRLPLAGQQTDAAASWGSPPEATEESDRAAAAAAAHVSDDHDVSAPGLLEQVDSPSHALMEYHQLDACLPSVSQHEVIPLHDRPQCIHSPCARDRATTTEPQDPTSSPTSSPQMEMPPSEFWRLPMATLDFSSDEDSGHPPLTVKPQPAEESTVSSVRLHAEASAKACTNGNNAEAMLCQTGNVDSSTEPGEPDVMANFWRLPLPELPDDP